MLQIVGPLLGVSAGVAGVVLANGTLSLSLIEFFLTVAFIIDPGLCPVQPMRIVVDDKGFTREESGEPNAQVCLRSDPEMFFRFFMARF